MLSTKIRTAIIGLAATLSVAAAAIGPMAPAASAVYIRYHYQYCNDMHRTFEEDAEKWAKSGGTDTKAYEEAVADVQIAAGNGCAWAESASHTKAPATSTSAGTLQLSSPESGPASPVRRVSTSTSALP